MKILSRTTIFSFICTTIFGLLIPLAKLSATGAPVSPIQIQNLSTFCRVWGFLKYFHSTVADGILPWDDLFLKEYQKIRSTTNLQEANTELISFCKFVESKRDKWKDVASIENFDTATVVATPNFDWMDNRQNISEELSSLLHKIAEGYKPIVNKYISGAVYFKNDNKYSEFKDNPFPSEELRILGLSRYWNILYYFNPNKYLLKDTWDSVLTEFIPRFIYSNDALEYHLTFCQLSSRLQDRSATVESDIITNFFGKGYLPFTLSKINGQIIITGMYGSNTAKWQQLMKNLHLENGDVLLNINNKNVSDIYTTLLSYVSASNNDGLDRELLLYMIRGKLGDSVSLTVSNGDRDTTIRTVYQNDLPPYIAENHNLTEAWGRFFDSIGYLDVGKITSRNIKPAMTFLCKRKAIIFDARDICYYTYPKFMPYLSYEMPYAYFTEPKLSRPGNIVRDEHTSTCGSSVGDKYKGQIIILVNEQTRGLSELAVMALQSMFTSVTIGSQTAGSSYDDTEISLPGGITAYFTKSGTYYPNGKHLDQEGVKIDIPLKPTIPGIREGRDELLERAISYIYNGM